MANEIQRYTFSAAPTGGLWKPVWNGNASSGDMTTAGGASDLTSCLAQIAGIDTQDNLSVSGSYADGFTVEFVGALVNADLAQLSYQDNTLTIADTTLAVQVLSDGDGGSTNESQRITHSGNGGSYTISWSGYGTTDSIPWNADLATITSAVIGRFGFGNVEVSAFIDGGDYTIGWIGGNAGLDIPTPTFSNSMTQGVSISVTTLQNGSPPLVTLSASPLMIAENGGQSTVTATLDSTHSADVTAVLTLGGTAGFLSDYSASSTSIVVPSGSLTGEITITAINDAAVESAETIVIDIFSVTNGTENGTQQVTITITDDDGQPIVLTIASLSQGRPMQYQQNSTTAPITFEMRHSSTGMLTTGLTPTVRLSKNGGAYAAPAGAVGEMTLGAYSIAPSATDFNTAGALRLIATAANCITTVKEMFVSAFSPTVGLPSVAPGLSGGLVVGSGTGTILLTSGGVVRANDSSNAALATSAMIDALNQSAARRIMLIVLPQFERPESSTRTYTIEARTYDGDGAAVNADSTPTLTATGITSGSLAANLSTATNAATGVYRWTYTLSSSDTLEQIRFDVSATISSSTFTLSAYTQVADFVAATWTTNDRATLEAILADTGTDGVVVASGSKTGYSLASTGLDQISVTDPGAPSGWNTLPKIINGVLRFFWKKTQKDATTIKAYADDGTTVNATMTHSTSGSTETKGPAT